MSITTQMFLNELSGSLNLNRDAQTQAHQGIHPVRHDRVHKRSGRIIASPDTIDGKVYISAFVRLKDDAQLSELENEGVVVQESFGKGLITTLIPIEKIETVAGISNVSRINVASQMSAFTNAARHKTNADDILTLSADAISAGLIQKYDGTGVVLGIIDTGIDFNHIAFKDAEGNSRIKQAYVYNGTSAKTYSGSTITSSLTDDKAEDHGTHTATTAGGSSVRVSGTTVTVTDDHASAAYGGIAPGADLYLAGINGLADTYLANAVKNMCTYADGQGKPLIVSNSWGSQIGPHDGTGDVADVYNSLFGDSHPNRIALFAASNDAGNGGYHLTGTATKSEPLRSILRFHYYSDTDDGFHYDGVIANIWARSTGVSSMTCKIYVLNSKTGAVLTSAEITPTTGGATVSGLSTYYSGSLYVYKDYVGSDKTQIMLYAEDFVSKSYDSNYNSNYTLAVEFAPSSGSCVIDAWGGNGGYFSDYLTTNGYKWMAGTDDGCYSDEATIANVIPIGAYVSKTDWNDYNGQAHSMADEYTMGDIAPFSSWGTAENNPAGTMIPWITAPGARLAAGVNHNHTASVDSYSYYGNTFNSDLVVNSTTNPYAMMEGTSMATPVAAGIVALWLQASLDANAQCKDLTVNDVKEIMRLTAINDEFTTGSNASHFGNGKIDALAGIKYILGDSSEPVIRASKKELTFKAQPDETYAQTITISSRNLTQAIAISLDDPDDVFSVDKTSLEPTEEAADLTVAFLSAAEGSYTATLTLSSEGAEPVTIALIATVIDGGTASDPYLNIAKYTTIDKAGWNTSLVNNLYQYTEYADDEVAWLTMPVYGGFVGAKYSTSSSTYNSGHPQKWIETDISRSTQCAETTWDATDEFQGSANYFTTDLAKGVGTNSTSSKTAKTVTFYVTNTTAVKLYFSQRKNSQTYPTTFGIYECTVNEDGSLASSATAVKSMTHSTEGTANLSITDLDKTKIYKVVASQARGYLYEIAFQTPLIYAPGDANHDKSVDIADAVAITRHIVGLLADDDPFFVKQADVNGDGTISIADATAIVDALLQ